MNIIMLGAQGTGKGTVAGILKEKLNIPHISTGEMFRKNIKEGTELGKIAEGLINAGNLVPDDITIKMVENRINEDDAVNGFILDGFPRNLAQAESLDEILAKKNQKIDLVVYLQTPTEEIVERVMARRECPKCKASYNMILSKPKNGEICDVCGTQIAKRADDTEEGLKKRLDIFFTQTAPLIDYYNNQGVILEETISLSINRLAKEAAEDVVNHINNK